MSTQENEIYEFLNRYPKLFVSVIEVSKSVGHRKQFNQDRTWARPVLRRLEMDGWIESNPFGEYRVMRRPDDTTTFLKALEMPGMALGETTIIMLSDTDEGGIGANESNPAPDRADSVGGSSLPSATGKR